MTTPAPDKRKRLSGWKMIGKALIGTLIGFFALPAAALAVGIVVYVFDKRCGTPGDSGGCEMGIAVMAAGAALPGAAIGFIVALALVYRQSRRRI
ncbi:MAG: hypothetical protein WC670_16150 [Pseudolabrys sp.]